MHREITSRGFTLLEVIIAVGLFATSVVVVISLLPGLTRQSTITTDTLAALRLPDALHVELVRLATPDYDTLAAQIPLMNPSSEAGFALVATRDAARLHSQDYLPPTSTVIPDDEQYFLVECWRFADEPLRYTGRNDCLTLAVQVTWPYRLPGAPSPVPEAARTHIMFTVALIQ